MKKLLLIILALSTLVLAGCTKEDPGWNNVQFVDETGTAYGIQQIDNKPRVSSMPYLYDIAEGNVAGHEPWGKMGYSPSSTATESTLWDAGTQYVFPVAAQQMEIVSSSANDTAGGSGVRSVYISYLDGAGNELSEIVALNGVGVVTTVAVNIYRINYFSAATVGATGKAEGNIVIRNLADTPIYSQISAGYTRARNIVYTVPINKTLFITSIAFSAGYKTPGKTVRFTTQATYDHIRDVALGANFFMPYSEVVLMDGTYEKQLEIPTSFPALTDIKVSIIGETLAQCTCSLRGWLESN